MSGLFKTVVHLLATTEAQAAQSKGPQPRTEPVTSPVIAGRSLRPRHA